jgi:thymidylate synthase (FAD)
MAMRKKILDHGYIELIEFWGSDERIVEAARMSTGKGFLGWGGYECPDGTLGDWAGKRHEADCRCKGTGQIVGDEKLLRYLHENRHHTPFEMAGMIIEVQAPILVFREWHRHRTQSYNEMSARYTPMPDVNYMPTPERCMMVSAANKQAGAVKGADELTHESVLAWLEELAGVYARAEAVYQSGLKRGIPKEIARLPVPVGRMSRMRASAVLRNWLAFETLRSEHVESGKAAQWEIRQYANALGDMIGECFPRTWALFTEKRA